MNYVVPFLMLFVPGLIALCIHEKALVRFTRENWQHLLWQYLFYSFAIVFTVYLVMYLDYPERLVSFSPLSEAHSSPLLVSFVVKYSLLATAAAWLLPKVWAGRHKLRDFFKNVKSYKIPDDE
ncbi:MAG: hypothetical protein LBI54_06915 [Lachnospiraceae bacterium]|jgi:hypothetical protein|nr:hypothetical protein [Lachnospiraceae bacterium]